MSYEKSHNLLLHTIHYNLKKLNRLYFNHQAKWATFIDNYLESPEMKSPGLFENFPCESIDLVHEELYTLYPVLPIARENFPDFKYLFDWIEQSKPEGSMNLESCWCLGCKNNRLIMFEERPSLGIAPAIVPLGASGITPPPSDFKLAKDMPPQDEIDHQLYLHNDMCVPENLPICKACRDKQYSQKKIVDRLINWSTGYFGEDVGFIYHERADGYEVYDVSLIYKESKDRYCFGTAINNQNFDQVLASHHDRAKSWFERCKNADMQRNSIPKQ
ncbi:MAG TPA: hypothetical protein VL443_06460 [Cyclobacteriaceae bacterium]|jgi:hypothetical protein|nr:hypothetical protein [Cyclobacteriaceae bacterium]